MGVTSVPLMQKMLAQYVEKELFADSFVRPFRNNHSYYPSKKAVRSHIHSALIAGKYTCIDQDNVDELIKRWQQEKPSDHFHFRKCGSTALTIHFPVTSQTFPTK